MDHPRIVFCTTCKGRLQHLRETLPRNLEDNAHYPNCGFVVLDYGDQDGLEDYIKSVFSRYGNGELAYYRHPATGPFHVSHAKNMAARCGMLEGADILVTLDADNFTGQGFAQFIAEKFREPGIFLCPDFPLIRSLPHGPGSPCRGYAGRLAIRSQDFTKAGGYDEIFNTWRGEDIDLIARLLRVGGYAMRHIDTCYLNAIPHNAAVRFKEYPEARRFETWKEAVAIDSRTETLVNYGKFGLGSVYRNFSPQSIELGPLPTRIFGVGMQRTATLSLHKALQILGFDSLHWGTGEAPLIWHEMRTTGRSNTLERWYVLSDNPIPLLYERLDQAYPGSKFILTIRDETKWLKSVERLWDPKYNPDRLLWDVYPFTNKVHTALYGRPDFDADVFLARYRRHNQEVLAYFKNRPQDLLVMDMSAGAGWPELCDFLGLPIPAIDYPKANHTNGPTGSRLNKWWYGSRKGPSAI
jgi:hypothetical protein